MAELRTLTALWLPVLPFGIPSSNVPLIQGVHKYSFTFGPLSGVPDKAANVPTFILVFFNMKLVGPDMPNASLRPYLLSDEVVDQALQTRKAHKEGLHVVTTWDWDSKLRRATFWMRKDVMEEMKPAKASWAVAIWRTDNWDRHSTPLPLAAVHDHGSWVRGEDTPAPDEFGDLEERSRNYYPRTMPGSENPNFDMLQKFLDMTLASIPGDSPEQRMGIAQRLMQEGMEGLKRKGV
jgi:hypothetical protein